MAIFTVTKDNYGYYLNFTVYQHGTTTPVNLTGKTVKLYVWNPRNPSTFLVDGEEATIVVAASGTCKYQTQSDDFDTAGVYLGKVNLSVSGYSEDMEPFYIVITGGREYITLPEVKGELDITGDEKDHILYSYVIRASDLIEKLCNRKFNKATETRYFDGDASPLFIDDCVSITTLKLDEDGDGTFEATMAATDYALKPYNKTPKTKVVLTSASDYGGFAAGVVKGVEIAGVWGYSEVPDMVAQAVLMQVCRWYKRRDTGYGVVVGSPETGEVTIYQGLDPDIKVMVKEYMRRDY